MFLDENGEKISKTKGNGVTIDEWLTYAPEESLAFYIYREPRKAKQLASRSSPGRSTNMSSSSPPIPAQEIGQAARQPGPPRPCRRRAAGADADQLRLAAEPRRRRLDRRQAICSGASSSATAPRRRRKPIPSSTGCSISRSLISATSSPIRCATGAPTEMEAAALRDLDARLAALPEDADAETIQTEVYEVGKAHPFESLRDWFKALYEILLGTSQGPRMGSFIALYGIANSRKLIAEALARRRDAPAAPPHRPRGRSPAAVRPPPACRDGRGGGGCGARRFRPG